jgi:hypothetical protein
MRSIRWATAIFAITAVSSAITVFSASQIVCENYAYTAVHYFEIGTNLRMRESAVSKPTRGGNQILKTISSGVSRHRSIGYALRGRRVPIAFLLAAQSPITDGRRCAGGLDSSRSSSDTSPPCGCRAGVFVGFDGAFSLRMARSPKSGIVSWHVG